MSSFTSLYTKEEMIESMDHHFYQEQEADKLSYSIGGSDAHHIVSFQIEKTKYPTTLELSSCDRYTIEQNLYASTTWMMPSAPNTRSIKKIPSPDQTSPSRNTPPQPQHHQQLTKNIPGSAGIRVCSDCKTTKTPLWRGGPQGPKSLCNACGIRQRKARRAAAAMAAGDVLPSEMQREKKTDGDRSLPYKKRGKLGATSKKELLFDDVEISMSKNPSATFHQVFPQDEKDAAILLMALSCGLIHG